MDQTLLVVGLGTSVGEPAMRALRDLPYRVAHVTSLEEARRLLPTEKPAFVVVACGPDAEPAGAAALLEALGPARGRVVFAPRAWLVSHVSVLARLVDELIPTEVGADDLALRLAWAEARAEHAHRRAVDDARAALAELPRDADPETLLAHAARVLSGLSGVRGVHVGWLGAEERQPIAQGADALPPAALRTRALAEGGVLDHPEGGERLVLLPLGAGPAALLTLRVTEAAGCLWAAVVRDELGRGLDTALLVDASLERVRRLERGCAERGRDLARLEARLARVSEGRDTLLRFLSHDLRTPLTVLVGHCQMLSEGLLPAPRRAASLETIRRQADRLGQMAAELLDRNRVVFEEPAACEQFSLDVLATEAISRALPGATRQGKSLCLDGPDDPALVEADPVVIGHVLDTVIDATLRRAPEGAEVRVTLAGDDARVVLRIAAEGPPWPGSILDADATPAGRGLADAAVRLRSFGGSVTTEPREGRLVLELPRAVPGTGGPLLVLGGEPDDVEVWSELVAPTGTPVAAHVFGPGLAAAIRRMAPSMVLLDATRDVAAALRVLEGPLAEAPVAGTPLVVVAPAGAAHLAERARSAGAFAVLPAPVDARLLFGTLGAARRADRRVSEAYVARVRDPATGFDTLATLLARLPSLVIAAGDAERDLPALFVSGIAPRAELHSSARAVTEQLVLWVGHELRTRAQPNELVARIDAGTLVLVAPARTRAEMVQIRDELTEQLSRARPRIGVTRVALQAQLEVADLGWSGDDSVESIVMGLRGAAEVGHGP